MFFSDSGHPDGWNFHGYGCHTFSWVNEQGKRHFIKYTFKKKGGQRFLSFDQVQKFSGIDPVSFVTNIFICNIILLTNI